MKCGNDEEASLGITSKLYVAHTDITRIIQMFFIRGHIAAPRLISRFLASIGCLRLESEASDGVGGIRLKYLTRNLIRYFETKFLIISNKF